MSNHSGQSATPDTLVRIASRTPLQVCEFLELSEEADELLDAHEQPTAFLTALLQGGHYMDAVHYMANAFGNRDAVSWACRCVRHVHPADLEPEDESALLSAEGWVKDLSQAAADEAALAAEAAGMESMAGLAALAAQMSGESISRPDLPVIPPPEGMAALAVAGAVLMAATEIEEPDEIEARYKACLALGIELAQSPLAGAR